MMHHEVYRKRKNTLNQDFHLFQSLLASNTGNYTWTIEAFFVTHNLLHQKILIVS